jgi:hypothetical protein
MDFATTAGDQAPVGGDRGMGEVRSNAFQMMAEEDVMLT